VLPAIGIQPSTISPYQSQPSPCSNPIHHGKTANNRTSTSHHHQICPNTTKPSPSPALTQTPQQLPPSIKFNPNREQDPKTKTIIIKHKHNHGAAPSSDLSSDAAAHHRSPAAITITITGHCSVCAAVHSHRFQEIRFQAAASRFTGVAPDHDLYSATASPT
jgi:hypothetical protein